MQIPLVSAGGHVTHHHYSLFFQHIDPQQAGYSFDCSKKGAILPSETGAALQKVLSNRADYLHPVVVDFSRTNYEHPVRACYCGEHLEMQHPRGGYGISCPECGNEYDGSGHQLDSTRYIGDSDVPESGDDE